MLMNLQDPMKPCVKGHHSLVLRAETAAEKYSWLARLRYASDGSSKNQPIKKYDSKDILAQKSDGSKTDGKEQSRRGTKEEAPSRVSPPLAIFKPSHSPARCHVLRERFLLLCSGLSRGAFPGESVCGQKPSFTLACCDVLLEHF